MKIIAYPNNSGSRYWRLEDPFKYLNQQKGFICKIGTNGIQDEELEIADVYVLQSTVDKEGIAKMYYHQQEHGKKIVCDVDDLLEISEDNPHKREHEITDAVFVIGQTLKIANLVTTTTMYLAEKLKKYNDNVVVLPNYMDMERWGGEVRPNSSKEIRIGWMGSITHLEDIKLVEKPLKKILDEFDNVKLVLMGDIRFKELFEGYNVEVRLGVPFDVYPAVLRGLQLDIGIAPLVDNEFNRCKSNIKTLEFALCGIPCVASNVEPYLDSLAYAYPKTDDDWYKDLKLLILSPGHARNIGKIARKTLDRDYSLKDHVNEWVETYKKLEYNQSSLTDK